jgi:hypothetical protein
MNTNRHNFQNRQEVVGAIMAARAVQDVKLKAWFAAGGDQEADEIGFREYTEANAEVNGLIAIYNDMRGQ